ncbi:hypothetical protein L2E82_24674 [Cichorium intybus]|uniref:Uncharacterized protein n=1 Tax=Cichorium intybus TaxID=13427 RepID=A0ACB9E122_CICIN|nr:hypothetical protein L2E82_24674 [Cichorium intybus]
MRNDNRSTTETSADDLIPPPNSAFSLGSQSHPNILSNSFQPHGQNDGSKGMEVFVGGLARSLREYNVQKVFAMILLKSIHSTSVKLKPIDQYLLNVDVMRGNLHKSLSATMEFKIESEPAGLPEIPVSPKMIFFYITQDAERHSLLPGLKSVVTMVTLTFVLVVLSLDRQKPENPLLLIRQYSDEEMEEDSSKEISHDFGDNSPAKLDE